MNEISFQAIQYLPRIVSVVVLLSLTWLLAKFTKSIVLRTMIRNNGDQTTKLLNYVSSACFWAVTLLFYPFILRAAGLDGPWIRQLQITIGQIFKNWPIWMLLSMVAAGLSYLFQHVPKNYSVLKKAPERSPKELKS